MLNADMLKEFYKGFPIELFEELKSNFRKDIIIIFIKEICSPRLTHLCFRKVYKDNDREIFKTIAEGLLKEITKAQVTHLSQKSQGGVGFYCAKVTVTYFLQVST